MGAQESKKLQSLEKQQQLLMKQHADMAERLAQEQENSKKLHEAHLEQMARLMLVLVASATTQKTTKTDKKLGEIEGDVYNITELISEGGFGQVYKAQSQKNNRFVAIKIMKNSPLIQREIENEIRFLRLTKKVSLDPHPVIDYYGCKVTPDLIFISLEMAHCDLLSFWFEGMAGRSAEERFTFGTIIIMYTLRALTFLERLNIIHGDIKPQNLVIVPNDKSFSIKLIDFGTVEKMHTVRALMTVDASKAYTQFFASPEFLKRDSKNLVSRRLHKKSDAWAAGVMFYLLFLGKLPWEDEHDYHNFVNDRDARDVVVPGEGGYKLIIELLLKKDPEERASAKETLLQMKGHPVLGVIVAAIEESFYPVDDVCRVKIPDSIRDEMANFATPQQRADATTRGGGAAATTTSSTLIPPRTRISCRYGRECYRKNPQHKEEYAHPGDSDYSETKAHMKIKCRYGAQCFRKNDKDHMAKYSH
jgi:serine/threonine protein kinase